MKLSRIYKWPAIAALPLFLSSCIVSINSNDYATLSKEERTHFRAFSLADADKVVSYDDSCVLERITHHDLELLNKTHPVLWVNEFAPWCGSVSCQNIGRFATIANASNGKAKLVLVALAYDYKQLQQRLAHSGINRMVYVLDTSYSSHFGRAMRQLFRPLKKAHQYYSNKVDDFVLRNDSVVYVRDGRITDDQFSMLLKSIADGGPAPQQTEFYAKKERR